MTRVVVDTHALLWFLRDDPRLSAVARVTLDQATNVLIPSICLVELIYLVEKGRIEQSDWTLLISQMGEPTSTFVLCPLDRLVVDSILLVPKTDVPELPDRVIAATALSRGLPLVTRDRKIRAAQIATIW